MSTIFPRSLDQLTSRFKQKANNQLSRRDRSTERLSVIIPTLWGPNPQFVLKLLHKLNRMRQVGEIILIDNDPSKAPEFPKDLHKLIHLPQRTNRFVNPSWNLGVEYARCPIVALCNDDILPPQKAFQLALEALMEPQPVGLIGLDKSCFEKHSDPRPPIIHNTHQRRYGYGCLMILRKAHYKPIPNWIRIYSGDTWLFEHQAAEGRYNLCIANLPIKRWKKKHSTTSSRPEFAPIKSTDDYSFGCIQDLHHHHTDAGVNRAILQALERIAAELKALRNELRDRGG